MIKYINSKKGKGSLNTEVNNYLFCLNNVCFENDGVRRYIIHIISLYEKLDHLSVDYVIGGLDEKRTNRKSKQYINKIKRLLRKIKNIDSNTFVDASKSLMEKNKNTDVGFINRYSKNNWDSDKISRTLMSDISSIIKRKRKDYLADPNNDISVSDEFSAVFFDEKNDFLEDKTIDSVLTVMDKQAKEIEEKLEEERVNAFNNFDDSSEYETSEELNEEKSISEINEENLESNDEVNYEDSVSEVGEEIIPLKTNEDINTDYLYTKNDLSRIENTNNEPISEKIEDEKIEVLNVDDYDFEQQDNGVRVLSKTELQELKKEIDNKEELFLNIDDIHLNQRLVIKSYISICEKNSEIDKKFHLEIDDLSSVYIINIYEQIYDFVGFLISELFEHIIHISKVSCEKSPETNNFKEQYVIDDSVIQIFGKYNIFIAKIQNYVKELNNNYYDMLSDADKKYLSDNLWNKYRLEDINPSFIREAVSLDLMAFINKNPFTLLQTVITEKRRNDYYKKYDLKRILENVDSSLEKYIPELVASIEITIRNNQVLSDNDKNEIMDRIKMCFAYFIGNIHGMKDLPEKSHIYLINYILNKVFNYNYDLDIMFDKCVLNIYSDEMDDYKSLGLFDRFLSGKSKPSKDRIKNKINLFCDDISKVDFNY